MYNHFDGQGRAPPGVNTDDKTGKCPLYDESHKRKDQQVDKAEKEAMAKVRAEHPDLSEEDLKIKFAKGVQSSSNQQPRDHRHHGDVPRHHNHHHRHHGHGIREAAIAALYNREFAMFEGVDNMLDEIGGTPPHALPQAREQGRQDREQIRAAQHRAHVEQIQQQREVFLRQQQRATYLAQQRASLLQQEALRDDLRKRLEQARRTAGLNQAAQTHRAPLTSMSDPVFPPFHLAHQAADVFRPTYNDQAFGNNAGTQHVGTQDDGRARRQPNKVEDRSHGLGGARNLEAPTQRREMNDFHRRTAEVNTERTAERVAEWHRYNADFNLDPPPRMPSEFPPTPTRRNPGFAPEALNPWVAGANDQAYL